METAKIADGVRDIIEFIKLSDTVMTEQVTILRSAADLLQQIIVSEATSASMVAAFRDVYNKK